MLRLVVGEVLKTAASQRQANVAIPCIRLASREQHTCDGYIGKRERRPHRVRRHGTYTVYSNICAWVCLCEQLEAFVERQTTASR